MFVLQKIYKKMLCCSPWLLLGPQASFELWSNSAKGGFAVWEYVVVLSEKGGWIPSWEVQIVRGELGAWGALRGEGCKEWEGLRIGRGYMRGAAPLGA